MSADVFKRVNAELVRKLDLARRFPPGTRGAETEKANFLRISIARWHNWGMRSTGIPTKEYERIADRLHWTTDQLLGKKSTGSSTIVALPQEPLFTPERYARLKALLVSLKNRPGGTDAFFAAWDAFMWRCEADFLGGPQRDGVSSRSRRAGLASPRQARRSAS